MIIPGYFYSVLSQEEKDHGGVDLKNREIFAKLIDETMMGKIIPGILGQGLELSHIKPIDESDHQKIKQILSMPELEGVIPKKPKKESEDEIEFDIQEKPVVLILAYMYGLMDKYFDMSDPNTQRDLETILRAIPSYLDIMIMVTMYLTNAFKQG